jgi:uncharacterized protein with PIN domain
VSITFLVVALRFLADGMLGKLVRWLRILGHDVTYFRSAEDKNLIKLANSESRVLLTRDQELVQQAINKDVKTFLVKGTDNVESLVDLANWFGFNLEIELSISRCPKCNMSLRLVTKESVLRQIPELTALYYNEFWKCIGCGQIYWQGAHWKIIIKTLEEAKLRLKIR